MINFKKEKLIKKHLGVATPDWIVKNCIKMLNEFEDEALTTPVVVSTLVCDIEKGTRCKDSFPNYKDGKCRICGGQAN